MPDSSSEEETICVAMILQADQPKRIWVHNINKKINEFGEFHMIFHDLTEDDKKFFIYSWGYGLSKIRVLLYASLYC